jgi:hypothetical protein
MADPTSEQYRQRAVEVEKLAETAISEDHRKQLLEIAAKWREMADERDAFWKRRVGDT